MMTEEKQTKPCDGTIPKGWEMPQFEDRISLIEGGFSVDFRGLRAPAPLVGTLKILAKIEAADILEATYPLTPIHLFPALLEAGWQWDIIHQSDEGTCLKIYKAVQTS